MRSVGGKSADFDNNPVPFSAPYLDHRDPGFSGNGNPKKEGSVAAVFYKFIYKSYGSNNLSASASS